MADLNSLLSTNPALAKQFQALPESDRAIIMQELGGGAAEKASSAQADLEYAQKNGTSLMGRKKAEAAAKAAVPMTTPEQELYNESVLGRGVGAMGSEAMQGAGEMLGGGLLEKIMGLVRTVNSPSVGAGAVTGSATQNVLAGLVPKVLGGGAGGIVPAAGAALVDAGTQLGTGQALGKMAIGGAKAAGKILPAIVTPGDLRSAGVEAVAKVAGAPVKAIDRAFNTPASKAAYTLAEASPPTSTQPLADIAEQAFLTHSEMSNPSQKALRYLSNLDKTLRQGANVSYGQAMKEIQALKRQADTALSGARPDAILGQTLMDAREAMIQHLDNISPMYRQANRLYRQESATLDIVNEMRKATPGQSLEKFIENNKDAAQAFSKDAVQEMLYIARQLSSVASATPAGGFRQVLSAVGDATLGKMLANPVGRAMLRSTLSSTKGTKAPLAFQAAIQAWDKMTPKADE